MAKSDTIDKLNSNIGETDSHHPSVLYETALTSKIDAFQPRPPNRPDNHPTAHKATADCFSSKTNTWKSFQKSPRIIYIKERYLKMLNKDLFMRNPLGMMGYDNNEILRAGEFGAVLARAGVGKTAFLVQLSLNALLRGKNVLHISLEDPVNKVSLWYQEVFNLIAEQYKVDQITQLWESLLPHRFIMTFRVEGFSVPKLKERLSDLTEQNIFSPQLMIIDGFPFDESAYQSLTEFKDLTQNYQMPAWFTIRTHRHENPGPDGIPMQLAQISDLFEIAIQLLPIGKEIHVKAVKGADSFSEHLDLRLDPSTMLVKKN
jgi:hypothetical protein